LICPECKAEAEMIIDEWNGWVWFCCNCWFKGREATDEEIEEYEKENQVQEQNRCQNRW